MSSTPAYDDDSSGFPSPYTSLPSSLEHAVSTAEEPASLESGGSSLEESFATSTPSAHVDVVRATETPLNTFSDDDDVVGSPPTTADEGPAALSNASTATVSPQLLSAQDYVPVPTNTVHVTGLMDRGDFTPELYAFLKDAFEPFGTVKQFIPLPSFCRCILVFSTIESAAWAKNALDHKLIWRDAPLRVYFGEHTHDAEDYYRDANLDVPENEALWLISPPGSPPVGWEPVREEGPNINPHASDLAQALAQLARRGLSPRLAPKEVGSSGKKSARGGLLAVPAGIPVLHSPGMKPKLMTFIPGDLFKPDKDDDVIDGGIPSFQLDVPEASTSSVPSLPTLAVPTPLTTTLTLPSISIEHWHDIDAASDDLETFSLDGTASPATTITEFAFQVDDGDKPGAAPQGLIERERQLESVYVGQHPHRSSVEIMGLGVGKPPRRSGTPGPPVMGSELSDGLCVAGNEKRIPRTAMPMFK